MNTIYQEIQKLPKADVHNHLHLGANRRIVRKKYGHLISEVPRSYKGLAGMIGYIKNDFNRILKSKDDVNYLMQNAIKTCIEDNVVYLEASIDLSISRFFDNSIEALIENTFALKEKYKTQIDFKPDLGINKELDVEKIHSDASLCIQSGVFNGIDIYGREDGQDLEKFMPIYKLAKSKGMKTKVHIGEFSNHNTIEEAIDILNPIEIQHGIRSVDSKNTLRKIVDHNIRLNVCPQSNIALGASDNYESHPIRVLFEEGIKFSINTDDFLLFDASISNQYVSLVQHRVFTLEEIKSINDDALTNSLKSINKTV